MLKKLTVGIPLLDALEQMTGYVKFMKDLVKKKRIISYEDVGDFHHYSVITFQILCKRRVTWMPSQFLI